jgi:ubiquinone/menaquinone biosynthesis C-methylase UbiE
MVDVHTRITEQPQAVLDTIAESMTTRAAEPAMQAICARYMGAIPAEAAGRVLEIGCGNGAATKLLMANLDPANLVGVDPAPPFIDMARTAFADEPRASFHVGDAAETGEADGSFDLVVAHTVFSHLPDPERALAEVHRVLKPGGHFVVFDGDFATTTVELFEGDPLQAAVMAIRRNIVHAPYIMRHLRQKMSRAGFAVNAIEPHGYIQTGSPDYLLSLLGRGVDAGVQEGELGADLAEGFKREAERRVEVGTFYGAILFSSMHARKTAAP